MDERIMQFRIGVMVLSTILIATILLILFGEAPHLFQEKIVVRIEVADAPGVTAKTPIRKAGILVGRVRKVELKEGRPVITAEIDADKDIGKDAIARINPSIIGDAKIELVRPEGRPTPQARLENGDEIKGVVSPDPVQVIADLQDRMAGAVESVSGTSDDLRKVILRVDKLLETNQERINSIVANTDDTLKVMEEAVSNVNEIVSDPETKKKLQEMLDEMPQVVRDARQTLGRMNETFDLVDENLENLKDVTGPLGARSEKLVTRLDEGAEKLDLLLAEMLTFSKSLNNPDGSLGQFINNPDLYQSLNRAATNIEELTVQLEPIIHDARVFSDKIARHPGIIVRDAVRPQAGTKSLPRFSSDDREPAVPQVQYEW